MSQNASGSLSPSQGAHERASLTSGTPGGGRLLSLDAYRGLIMISLAFNGFGLAATARGMLEQNPDSSLWQEILRQFSHAQWVGWGYWDMIQPSFMFMVGVSMVYSYAKRADMGHSYLQMFCHAAVRSVVLILLGVFLSSNGSGSTNWSFMNVLSQIGLGYIFLFLVLDRGWIAQMSLAAVLLLATWAMYTFYSGPGMDLVEGNKTVAVTAEWAQAELTEVDSAWHKSANVGQAVDLRFLNWFPRERPFEFNGGGYQTINFIPSLATMIFGLLCGHLVRGGLEWWAKLLLLLVGGGIGIAAGYALDDFGVCPLVKRIWTPSWALFSSGICCWILFTFYLVFDIIRLRFLAYPMVVVGVNSIAMYLMAQMLKPWTGRSLSTHLNVPCEALFGTSLFELFGDAYQPMTKAIMIGLAFWCVCYWMYRQKIYVRI